MESGAIYISKTAEDKDSYYIFNVEELGTEEDFGDSSFCKDLNFDVDQVPEIYQATTPPSRDIIGYEKADFLVFLDLIGKLTDDIKCLQSNSKYGINLILPSAKFIQCQTVIRNVLKSSPNPDITSLWAAISNGTNIQYDQYKNTKQVLTALRKDHEDRITHELISQGFIMSSILKLSNLKVRGL